jgi:hypothetical protein
MDVLPKRFHFGQEPPPVFGEAARLESQLFAELRAARDVRGCGGRVQSLIGTASRGRCPT